MYVSTLYIYPKIRKRQTFAQTLYLASSLAMATTAEPILLHPDHVSHDYVVYLGVAGMMTLLATVCVVLRFISRKLTLFWYWDDWAILGALVFAYGYLVTTALAATVGGAGYSINQYSLPQLERYLQASGHILHSLLEPKPSHLLKLKLASRSLLPTVSFTMPVLPCPRLRSYSYIVVSLRWTDRFCSPYALWVAS